MLRLVGTITLPAAIARNNTNTGAAVLDLVTPGTLLDTKVRIIVPGVGGNDWTIAAAADSPAAGGVTLTVTPGAKTIVIHFEDGVSTVADFEAAVAALTGTSKVFAVDTIGTPGNLLASPGDVFGATHFAGGAAGAFVIPAAAKKVHLRTTASDVGVEVGCDGDAVSAFLTTAARGYPLAASTVKDFMTTAGSPGIVSGISTGGATLKVWVEG